MTSDVLTATQQVVATSAELISRVGNLVYPLDITLAGGDFVQHRAAPESGASTTDDDEASATGGI